MRTLLFAAALVLAPTAAAAEIAVTGAWVRLIPGGGPSAGYATIENRGSEPIALVGADCDAYGKVMLHRSVESGGTSRMEHVARLTVPPGKTERLAPGGHHLMLMAPEDPPKVGQKLAITLRFTDGTTREVAFAVKPPYSQGPQ